MKTAIGAIALSLVVSACSSNPVAETPQETGIQGRWKWIESVGRDSEEHLSATEDDRRTIRFRADSVYELYMNDSLTRSSPYSITRVTSAFHVGPLDLITLSDRPMSGESYAVTLVTADSLRLENTAPEGYISVYTRIR